MKTKRKDTRNPSERIYKISQVEYIRMRRDEKAKRQIKRMVLELFDKVKNWQ